MVGEETHLSQSEDYGCEGSDVTETEEIADR